MHYETVPWLTTYTGIKFHFLDPQPEEICIEDIAHALSLTCRFGGHCACMYSVAEHSVRVASQPEILPSSKIAALLHDAEETYIPDIPTPIKHASLEIQRLNSRINRAVKRKFRIERADWATIHRVDKRMLVTETLALDVDTSDWDGKEEPYRHLALGDFGWLPDKAEAAFLFAFGYYNKLFGVGGTAGA